MAAYIRAVWDLTPDTPHPHRGRASAEQLGAVITQVLTWDLA